MTDERIRISIAEALDWKHTKGEDPRYVGTFDQSGWTSPKGRFYPSDWTRKSEIGLPDFPRDLNAMHDAVMRQTPEFRLKMNGILMDILNPDKAFALDRAFNATARQRCEACLRTVGKWVEP